MLLHVHGTKNGAKDDQVNPLQRSHSEIHPFAALHTADLARKLAASVFIMNGGISKARTRRSPTGGYCELECRYECPQLPVRG